MNSVPKQMLKKKPTEIELKDRLVKDWSSKLEVCGFFNHYLEYTDEII